MDIKTKSFYTCKCCGKTSTVQQKIADCENSHIGIDADQTVEASYKKGSRYPSELRIVMEDSATGVYVWVATMPAPEKKEENHE